MKIMVAYAGGLDVDNAVLDVAKNHAKAFKATVYVVCSMKHVAEKQMNELEKLEKKLAYIRGAFEEEGIDCETHVLVRGLTPGEDIVEFATDKKVDEIIIGIEKKSKVGKLLFGSNAQIIILEAPCPVVSVK